MIVLGLDQSRKNTGFCHGDSASEKVPTWGIQPFESYGENGVLLIREVRKWAISLMEVIRPEVVYCEQIVISLARFNTQTVYEQFEIVAGIEAACDFIGCECFMVDIGTWRKRGLGRGNAPKWTPEQDRTNWLKDAAKTACADRGWLIDSHHAAEAALIWDYGCAHADIEYRRRTSARVTRTRMAMETLAREHGERIAA